MGIETAIIGSAVLGGLSASQAARSQQKATETAAQASQASTQAGIDAQERMFAKQMELQEPFRQTGLAAQNRLADLLGISGRTDMPGYGTALQPFSMANYQADPGYAFRLKKGLEAMDRTAAARGGLLSGNQLRGATQYGQDLASQEYQNAFNRFQTERSNILNPLQSLGNVSQTSTNALTSAAGGLGANIGQMYGNLGNALSANALAAGNARASGYVGLANAATGGLGQYLNYRQNQQLMNLYGGGAGTPAPTYPSYAAPDYMA